MADLYRKTYVIDKERNELVYGDSADLDDVIKFYIKWSRQIDDGSIVISGRHAAKLNKLYDLAQHNPEFFGNPFPGTNKLDTVIDKLEKLIDEFNTHFNIRS